jgi:hypothetical protein
VNRATLVALLLRLDAAAIRTVLRANRAACSALQVRDLVIVAS